MTPIRKTGHNYRFQKPKKITPTLQKIIDEWNQEANDIGYFPFNQIGKMTLIKPLKDKQ